MIRDHLNRTRVLIKIIYAIWANLVFSIYIKSKYKKDTYV